MYKIRWTFNGNLELIKPNTSLMGNYYINRGIKLFNRLPINIKFKTILYAIFTKSCLISVFIVTIIPNSYIYYLELVLVYYFVFIFINIVYCIKLCIIN